MNHGVKGGYKMSYLYFIARVQLIYMPAVHESPSVDTLEDSGVHAWHPDDQHFC